MAARLTFGSVIWMAWAVSLEGRYDPQGVLVIMAERTEAETLAVEVRRKGHRVIVRPYPDDNEVASPAQDLHTVAGTRSV